MKKDNHITELPLGFSMAMAKNPKALTGFSNLSEVEQQEIIDRCHNAASKSEMQQIVDSIIQPKTS